MLLTFLYFVGILLMTTDSVHSELVFLSVVLVDVCICILNYYICLLHNANFISKSDGSILCAQC
jgi:hypothetical protein